MDGRIHDDVALAIDAERIVGRSIEATDVKKVRKAWK